MVAIKKETKNQATCREIGTCGRYHLIYHGRSISRYLIYRKNKYLFRFWINQSISAPLDYPKSGCDLATCTNQLPNPNSRLRIFLVWLVYKKIRLQNSRSHLPVEVRSERRGIPYADKFMTLDNSWRNIVDFKNITTLWNSSVHNMVTHETTWTNEWKHRINMYDRNPSSCKGFYFQS